jgi:hypothetical protein
MYASESMHWYHRDGTPCYEVPRADGKSMRATTLADARKLDLLPSVTSIMKCAARPQLQRWMSEQLLMAALTLPRKPDESEKSWISRVWQDSSEQGRKAAEHGSRIHAAIEGHFLGKAPDPDMWPYVRWTAEVIRKEFGMLEWLPEKSFADTEMGYGGKVDLHAEGVVLDFKGKDGDLVGVECYDEHYMQLAAYARGLKMPGARCGIVFVSRTEPGTVKIVMHTPEQTMRGWKMFHALLQYWKANNRIKEMA